LIIIMSAIGTITINEKIKTVHNNGYKK
jgi:hypothetical protein